MNITQLGIVKITICMQMLNTWIAGDSPGHPTTHYNTVYYHLTTPVQGSHHYPTNTPHL